MFQKVLLKEQVSIFQQNIFSDHLQYDISFIGTISIFRRAEDTSSSKISINIFNSRLYYQNNDMVQYSIDENVCQQP